MAKAEATADWGDAASANSGRSAVRPIGAMWGWLALLVGIAAGAGWVPVALKLSALIPATELGPATSLFYLLVFGPLIAIAVVLGLLSRQPVLRAGDRPLLWTSTSFAVGTIAILAAAGFAWLSGSLHPALHPAVTVPGLIALSIALTLLQSGAEEVLFRGWLQPALTARIGVPAGVLAGAVIFAAFHAISAYPSPVSAINLVLGGVWFGLLALRSGGILAPLAAHFAYNAIEDCGFGLVPNGGPNGNEWVNPLGALRDLDLVGSPIWGSGPEGLNASLGLTAALVAMILPLLAPQVPRPVPVVVRGPLPNHRLI